MTALNFSNTEIKTTPKKQDTKQKQQQQQQKKKGSSNLDKQAVGMERKKGPLTVS
jgi:hypothetical protein